ncbi:50S ribosomal protein L11 methyltransferase [Pseudogemmobacter faecipullorum]|uniref:Ribosomal protein L11 methyltransferase n=1 Tax=Pseudogemmobacter faecipullorum TaxID=2755041 RepID=A0ABS8CGG5_9RHOB|nr:50S ribosomal protein L11 methyltransferase [Pseudogemmobacter faecipullorum]MCB5408486.1 50S ribosomal protein L11 methyltransferase [Pseudogemmobacter faecipullorum]
MQNWSALTTLAGEPAARALGEALEDLDIEPLGVGVFEVEDGSGLWEVGAYFEEEPDDIILEILATAFGAKSFVVSEIPEFDWVSKVQRELHPVDAGRFFVYGSHDADKVPEGRVALLIEATMAFGTGHHGTTLGCLLAFDKLYTAGYRPAKVADIGAGTAVLAMAAAKMLPEAHIIASDIDPVAVDVAKANVAVNDLAGRIDCLEAAGFDHRRLKAGAPWDLVFANILKGPLIELAPAMKAMTASGSKLILSGLLAVQAEGIIAAYVEQGFRLEDRNDLGEWSALVLERI